jgi:hypothetical protein
MLQLLLDASLQVLLAALALPLVIPADAATVAYLRAQF